MEVPFKLAAIFKQLRLPSAPLNVYVIGSRLWGTARADSDWDLLIVVEGSFAKASVHANTLVDATVVGQPEFVDLVRQHHSLALLCLWSPPENVLQRRFDPLGSFKLDAKQLVDATVQETERDLKHAAKVRQKGNEKQADKVLVHAYRLLLFADQILASGRITDHTCANAVHRALLEQQGAWHDAQFSGDEAEAHDSPPSPSNAEELCASIVSLQQKLSAKVV
eukprot:TRINITY_DN42603_c0_g1_i1.p2 TRINITY_DN42603_c0_g1~~TRINITY_DN42603_c0_g1_i1.p2  ORF type:complete len:232 (-),score=52.88 TRINITY_DN42603_c0_g1_i1:21-689(-)